MSSQLRRNAATQVFVSADALDRDAIDLDDDTSHHLTRVLRLRPGEGVAVSDGAGRWRPTVVAAAGSAFRLDATGDVESVPRPHAPITIATAIPKGDRVDWLVQKAVEIGVDTIQLVHAERSSVRWRPERAAKQIARLTRIAHEAARQSRRVWLPEVLGPVPAADIVTGAVMAEPGGRPIGPGDTFIAVGPEGGWTQSELDHAAGHVQLGHNVMRTETAAIVATTLCVTNSHGNVHPRD